MLDEREMQLRDQADVDDLLIEPAYEGAAPVRIRPRRRKGRLPFLLAVAWLALVAGVAITADWLPLAPPNELILEPPPRTPPSFQLPEPFGTDNLGRSETSRLIYGARQSLAISLFAVSISFLLGGLIGIFSGYLRGPTDRIATILIDSVLAFPGIVLLVAIGVVVTPTLPILVLELGFLGIPGFARLSRANTLTFSKREFVTASRAMGATRARTVFGELAPNVVFPLLSYAFLAAALVMVAEGSLSFLGLGIPPPTPSWGGMIASGKPFLATEPYLVFLPSGAMVLTILSFNVVGDRVRRRFDRDAVL